MVEMQFHRVCSGLLEKLSVRGPTAHSGAVERCHHRNADCCLHFPQVFEVFIRTKSELRLRRVACRLRKRLAVALRVEECRHLLACDLFLKHRPQHESSSSLVFQFPRDIDIIGKGSGPDNERVRQAPAEIGCSEIHLLSSPFELPEELSSSFVFSAGKVIAASCWY